MVVEQIPNYAANEAWSRSISMVRELLDYLRNPDSGADRGRGFSALISEGERVEAALENAADLRKSGAYAVPSPALLDAVELSINFEVDVVVATEIKKHRNPEAEKWTIFQLLNAASAT